MNKTRGASDAFVLLGGPPYEEEANQTSLQMFHALGANGKSLYVCRRFQGSLVRRLVRGSLGKSTTYLRPGLRQIHDESYVLVLPTILDVLPLVSPEWSRKLAMHITRRCLSAALKKLGWSAPVLISYWWMFPEIAQMSCWRTRVFDVIDRHWGYSHIASNRARGTNLKLALETAQASNNVCVVSDALAAELERLGESCTVLPNAIDLRRVHRVKPLRRPRENLAVYAGGWNDRLDVDLLERLVRRNSDWEFAFLGSGPESRLSRYENVKFYGDVPYENVLATLKTARIGLIPFRINAFTEASNFLKVLDYLACGVQVGATPIKNLQQWSEQNPDHLLICESDERWMQLFDDAKEASQDYSRDLNKVDLSGFTTDVRAEALARSASSASNRFFDE